MKLRTVRAACQRRLQQAACRGELAPGAQQIGQIDQRLDAARLQRQNPGKKLLRHARLAQGAGGIAQREQDRVSDGAAASACSKHSMASKCRPAADSFRPLS